MQTHLIKKHFALNQDFDDYFRHLGEETNLKHGIDFFYFILLSIVACQQLMDSQTTENT